ncbi:hypothetical protein IEQ34_011600 [Dendrobium chrysotoxum]|uniref:Expansin-like EG45 domain-containing protein n=1 Tax=Dendrobium chrysotoxum TaxID=161865 RepID=A0AAV7GQ97_DENCH|nr:hypothetical protein IEQ34_011600 [Dendrobium chrysotoxum]
MGTMIAAASDVIWDNHTACGRNYRVTCTGPINEGDSEPCKGTSVIVKIVDYCPLVVRPPLISRKSFLCCRRFKCRQDQNWLYTVNPQIDVKLFCVDTDAIQR